MDDNRSPPPKLGKHGGARVRGQQGNTETAENAGITLVRMRGTSREYILARLRRDGYGDWVEAIESGQGSAYAAAVELGWTKRPATRSGENRPRPRAIDVAALIG